MVKTKTEEKLDYVMVFAVPKLIGTYNINRVYQIFEIRTVCLLIKKTN